MKNLYFFVALLLIGSGCDTNTGAKEETTDQTEAVMEEVPSDKKQLRHVVLFKFKETATDADIQQVEEAFAALPAKIPQIKAFEWGTNNSPEGLDKGFTHCFFLSFDSEEDRAIYLPHPDHKAFGELLGPHLEDVTVVDYWTGD